MADELFAPLSLEHATKLRSGTSSRSCDALRITEEKRHRFSESGWARRHSRGNLINLTAGREFSWVDPTPSLEIRWRQDNGSCPALISFAMPSESGCNATSCALFEIDLRTRTSAFLAAPRGAPKFTHSDVLRIVKRTAKRRVIRRAGKDHMAFWSIGEQQDRGHWQAASRAKGNEKLWRRRHLVLAIPVLCCSRFWRKSAAFHCIRKRRCRSSPTLPSLFLPLGVAGLGRAS